MRMECRMSHCLDSNWKRPLVIAVGGDIVDRASLCYEVGNANLHIEPVETFDELLPGDFAITDVFVVWRDLELVERLKSRMAATGSFASIIVFLSRPLIDEVVAAMEAGASDVVEWPCRPTAFEDSVVAAIRKRRAEMPRWERVRLARERLQSLSGREREVISLVASGLSSKEIAGELSISHRTVEIHRANALAKLQVEHTIDAVRLVLEATLYDDGRADGEERRGAHAA